MFTEKKFLIGVLRMTFPKFYYTLYVMYGKGSLTVTDLNQHWFFIKSSGSHTVGRIWHSDTQIHFDISSFWSSRNMWQHCLMSRRWSSSFSLRFFFLALLSGFSGQRAIEVAGTANYLICGRTFKLFWHEPIQQHHIKRFLQFMLPLNNRAPFIHSKSLKR